MEDGKLGKYEISGILGKGAMGTVYDARDPIIDRRVAIKTLTLPEAGDTETQEELARFKREAQAAGRLTHPNIVGVFDYGETAKLAYIVMEFVDGPSLKSLLDKNDRFPTTETVRIMEALLAGLQFSHERGVVHRDIKPANVMLTRDGQVKIADFGIARIESSSMTQAGTIMGTPAYMSPEQFMGQTVDARTDIYSSGVLLYQLLTGERPFEGSMTAIMHKVLNVAPPRPSQLSVTVPEMLDDVVARAMAKRPEQRFGSAAEFAQALRAAYEGQATALAVDDAEATLVAAPSLSPAPASHPTPAKPQVPGQTSTVVPKRNMVPVLAGVSALVLASVGAGWYWFTARAPGPATTPAITASSSPPATSARPDTAPVPVPVPLPAPDPAPAAAPAGTSPVPAPTPPAGPLPSDTASTTRPPPTDSTVPPPTQAPSPSGLRAALQATVATVPCALVEGDVANDGSTVITGLASRANAPALQRMISEATQRGPLAWRVASFDGPFCGLLDAIRPAARRFGTQGPDVQFGLKSGLSKLHENDSVVPRFVMPDYAGYAQISYVTGDGTLVHLYPSNEARQVDINTPDGKRQSLKVPGMDSRQFAAGATVTIADPETCRCKPEEVGWQVAPPYGVDMMIIAVSAQPLFAQRRPPEDTADSYLRDLQAALDSATRRGVRVNTRAVLVETEAR